MFISDDGPPNSDNASLHGPEPEHAILLHQPKLSLPQQPPSRLHAPVVSTLSSFIVFGRLIGEFVWRLAGLVSRSVGFAIFLRIATGFEAPAPRELGTALGYQAAT